MKVLVILLFALKLIAFDAASASKIFDKIFHAMIEKEIVTVYTSNPSYQEVILKAGKLSLSKDFKNADIILVDSFEEIPKSSNHLLLFTTSYPVFKATEDAVGAFYWEHGKIRIEFVRSRLSDKKITLPASFTKYIKEAL